MELKRELRLEGVKKNVGDFTLHADFRLGEGERAVLVGESGMGKTTLLRIIAGLEPLIAANGDGGRVCIGGRDDTTDWPPERRRIGYVFQDAALFPALDVLGNVTFGLTGISKKEARSLALDWLERMGMKDRAHSPVAQLSGGEAQRVAFARALIWKPAVILLDEPFSALDSKMREVLRSELLKLHQLHPAPLLMVSHDVGDSDAIANVRLELRPVSGSKDRFVMRC